MAIILDFPSTAARRPSDLHLPAGSGELIAMNHIDLTTVVETIKVLRDLGRSHLLDAFNRGKPAGHRPPS